MKIINYDNGFKICFIPVKKVRVISITLVVRNGNIYENEKTLGFSHLLEHILVESSKKYR